jgi:hypothetical protein
MMFWFFAHSSCISESYNFRAARLVGFRSWVARLWVFDICALFEVIEPRRTPLRPIVRPERNIVISLYISAQSTEPRKSASFFVAWRSYGTKNSD